MPENRVLHSNITGWCDLDSRMAEAHQTNGSLRCCADSENTLQLTTFVTVITLAERNCPSRFTASLTTPQGNPSQLPKAQTHSHVYITDVRVLPVHTEAF